MTGKKSEHVFAMFYAPWCGHCQTAKPEFQQTYGGKAQDYADYRNNKVSDGVSLVIVNGDDYPEMMEKFGVQGFPTFKLLEGVSNRKTLNSKKIKDYNGGRNSNEFELFLNTSAGGDPSMVQNGGGFSKSMKNQDPYYKLYKKYKAKYKTESA